MCRLSIIFIMSALVSLASCVKRDFSADKLQNELNEYVKDKDCRIGIAVIYKEDTVQVRGNENFPMLSVYKFPQAIAVSRICEARGLAPGDSINIKGEELLPDTHSPMRDRYGESDIKLPVGELLGYTLMVSDNNACDILFRLIGGTATADSVIKSLGYGEITIANTEEEMNADPRLCQQNCATPLALAGLMNDFYNTGNDNEWIRTVKLYLESCETGATRIPGGNFDGETLIGHKTGTGPRDESGRIIAVNDVGYIEFSSGESYVLAVMIAQSAENLEDTECMIGEISEIVRRNIEGLR